MPRFKLLALAAIAMFAMTVAADDRKNEGKSERTGTKKEDAHQGNHGPYMHCAKACADCALICDACGAHCAKLVAEGKKEHLHTLATCQDCATACSAAACVTARHGPFSDVICTACAETCKRCGDACDKHSHDELMKQCAEECRKCEKACREMVKHAGHEGHEGRETR